MKGKSFPYIWSSGNDESYPTKHIVQLSGSVAIGFYVTLDFIFQGKGSNIIGGVFSCCVSKCVTCGKIVPLETRCFVLME